METAPGEQGQVEGGPFGTSLHQGQRCPLYGLVMGLGDSRTLFAHCTTTPRLATFRGGHLRAVEAFGGDPRARLFLGRACVDLADLNRQAVLWWATVANARGHATTGEAPAVQLARDPWLSWTGRPPDETHVVLPRRVSSAGRVAEAGHPDAVPSLSGGRPVQLRVDTEPARLESGAEAACLALHPLLPRHGRQSLQPDQLDGQPSIDQKTLQELAQRRFLDQGEHVICLGPPGGGNTHLAVALGLKAAEAGSRVLGSPATALVTTLAKALAVHRVADRLTRLCQPTRLIIDASGDLPLDTRDAPGLFQRVSRRDERGAIILTSHTYRATGGPSLVAIT